MKKTILTTAFALAIVTSVSAADNVKATVHADKAGAKINREIYGQFSEHLGTCIYGGLWVGEDSKIPNIQGYRKDVFEALKALKIPVLRWPGGCFADDYHWMDGIGPKDLPTETMQVSKAYFKEKAGAKDAGYRPCPMLSASAAKTTDGSLVLAITNVSLDKAQTIDFQIDGYQAKSVSGEILTSKKADDYNDFQHPDVVSPKPFKDAKLKKNVVTVKVPAKSLIVLNIK